MDGKIFAATFTAVFLAEVADKTQLVGIGMTAKSGKPISVWFGSVCGYALVTVVSVLLGAFAAKFLKPEIIKYVAGIIFIIIGALILWGKL